MKLHLTEKNEKNTVIPYLECADGNFVAVANKYLRHIALTRATTRPISTWAAYGKTLEVYFAFLGEYSLSWNDINQGHMEIWRDELLRDNVDAMRIRRLIRSVSMFYQWALNEGLIARLPFLRKDLIVNPTTQSITEGKHKGILSKNEANRFIAAIEPNLMRLMGKLILRSGMHPDEVTTLDLRNLPLPVETGDNERRIYKMNVTGDTNEGNRWVPVPHDLAKELWSFLTFDRFRQANAYEKAHGTSTFRLFLHNRGELVETDELEQAFSEAAIVSHITCTPIQMQQTFGTHAYLHLVAQKSHEIALKAVRFHMNDRRFIPPVVST